MLLIIIIVKSLQKEKIAQITYYEPQSTGINLQSHLVSDWTPRRLTLPYTKDFRIWRGKKSSFLYRPSCGNETLWPLKLTGTFSRCSNIYYVWQSEFRIQNNFCFFCNFCKFLPRAIFKVECLLLTDLRVLTLHCCGLTHWRLNKIKINIYLRLSVWVKLWQNSREQNSKLWYGYDWKVKNKKPLAVRHYGIKVFETC